MTIQICPEADPNETLLGGHLMRLEKSDGEREVWRCTRCGFTRIETRRARCSRCGGFKHEFAPWWCGTKDQHGG